MDRQKLRALVFEKTGIKVDCDDPIFALVALNEAVLADTVERQVALLDAAAQELARQARGAAAGAPAAPLAPAGDAPPLAVASQAAAPFAPRDWRLLGGAAAVAAFSALLVLAGQAWLAKPPVIPAPAVTALALTPQQSAAIEQGDKLARAVQKLDPKSRALVQAEMQKP
ncbi:MULTISPECIES: hypothetical protein [unclassified Janthinobacterium]|uniref:hypothetical protein n=1 Tax=unclassified Janthinobacterium TaxID=2610881 RepID=UPI00034BB881|nr:MULTISPECIES: hypothetical protein [unclassified Janthinobacterium]MEC5163765.1 hypothetical protein [Janthinobacterium sp. CG_S6]